MTRTNQCNFLVDFAGNKYFGETSISKNKTTPFTRLFGYVHDSEDSRPVPSLRFVAYGYKAELAYAYIESGTRAFVFCYIQQREDHGNVILEFVITDIQYISGENKEEGERKRLELVERGVIKPSYKDLHPEYVGKRQFEDSETNA